MVDARRYRSKLMWVAAVSAAAGLATWRGGASRSVAAPPTPPPSAQDRVADINNRITNSPQLAWLRSSERVVGEVQRGVLDPWRTAWIARDAAAFARVFAPDAQAPAWASAARTQRRERGGIRELAWRPASAAPGDEAARYLAGLSQVDAVQLDVVRVETEGERASVDLRLDLRARATGGALREDRGRLRADLVRRSGEWRITRLEAVDDLETLEPVAGRRPAFEDATASAGLDRVARVDRREAIRRGGYAIAVADCDGDQRADVLVGNHGALQLFRSTARGFEDITASSGLAGETLVKSAAFADMDNDGLQDILLVRFVDSPDTHARGDRMVDDMWDGPAGGGDFIAYRNRGDGRFERKGNVLTRSRHYDRSMPLAVSDFDGDGRLDVYVGFPGARDFTNDLSNTGGRNDRTHQGLWLNRGDWRFLETAQIAEARGSGNSRGIFPHAVLATDLSGDGRADILVVDDSGNISPVYRNEGNGAFREATREMGLAVEGWGMGASSADYDGDGALDLVLTSISFAAAERAQARLESPSVQLPAELRAELRNVANRGVHLFHNRGNGTFEDATVRAGVPWAGAAPAGAEWFDYDNDGLLDLYVANGLWSGGPEDAESFFVQLTLDRETRSEQIRDLAMSMPGAIGAGANPMLSILRDFRGRLSNPTAGPISATPTLSLGARQRNRLFRNNGDGTFTDVAFLEGADRIEDGYVMAPVDVDNDGRLDLVLRNADPPPGQAFLPVVYLRNTGAEGRSLRVALRGTTNNRFGVGARVVATVGGRSLVREIRSVNGASQADPAAYFGLGTAGRVDGIEVRWPSGRVERFPGVDAGRVELREGDGTT